MASFSNIFTHKYETQSSIEIPLLLLSSMLLVGHDDAQLKMKKYEEYPSSAVSHLLFSSLWLVFFG